MKAMPTAKALSPTPFSCWNGPWTKQENWVWRRMSKGERREWSRRFSEWKAEQWATETSTGTTVPEPAYPPQGGPEVHGDFLSWGEIPKAKATSIAVIQFDEEEEELFGNAAPERVARQGCGPTPRSVRPCSSAAAHRRRCRWTWKVASRATYRRLANP